jgi:hypothetical protein
MDFCDEQCVAYVPQDQAHQTALVGPCCRMLSLLALRLEP